MLQLSARPRRVLSLSSVLLSVLTAWSPIARAETTVVDEAKKARILAQGVPADLLERVLKFRAENLGRRFQQETYACSDKPEGSVRPCEENKRSRSSREITVPDHPYLLIVDYRQSSLNERLYVIHLPSAQVTKMQVTHGKNTGNLYAYRFSNIKDSRQTSLGVYMLGEPYTGQYGSTLRMYGLQGSNDQAYNRDIVMHGAPYASPDFPKSLNYKTKKPFGRLGVSWGCPAIALANAKKWFPLLKNGALIYHAHPELEETAQNGREVVGVNPEAITE